MSALHAFHDPCISRDIGYVRPDRLTSKEGETMFVKETAHHEQEAIEEVYIRLRDRFDALDGGEIGAVVHGVAEEFSDARVRDFVPVLVEHIAKDRLTSRHAESVGAPDLPTTGHGAHRRAD